jgi:hypothetical protein
MAGAPGRHAACSNVDDIVFEEPSIPASVAVSVTETKACGEGARSIGVVATHTGFLFGYPRIGEEMILFWEPGCRLVTTPVKRVFRSTSSATICVETENSVYEIAFADERAV